jgi:recombinational DNA repair protein RecR
MLAVYISAECGMTSSKVRKLGQGVNVGGSFVVVGMGKTFAKAW